MCGTWWMGEASSLTFPDLTLGFFSNKLPSEKLVGLEGLEPSPLGLKGPCNAIMLQSRNFSPNPHVWESLCETDMRGPHLTRPVFRRHFGQDGCPLAGYPTKTFCGIESRLLSLQGDVYSVLAHQYPEGRPRMSVGHH